MTAGISSVKMAIMKKIIRFFDKFEDKVRAFLSKHPLWYAMIAGIGLVLFWRGVWHTTDSISEIIWHGADLNSSLDLASSFWDGPISFVVGSAILLAGGVFVSELLGKEIIISGLRGEANLSKKTEVEVRTETGAIGSIREEIRMVINRLDGIERKLDGRRPSSPKGGEAE